MIKMLKNLSAKFRICTQNYDYLLNLVDIYAHWSLLIAHVLASLFEDKSFASITHVSTIVEVEDLG